MAEQAYNTTGQTNLDELIAAERKRANERIAKLKRAAAAEKRRVDTRVVDLLRETEPDLYERLACEAGDALAAEKAKRSKRARASAEPSPVESVGDGGSPDDDAQETRQPWTG